MKTHSATHGNTGATNTNEAIEARELALWATQPETFTAYIVDGLATTWPGTKLGVVVKRDRYSTNISRNMVSIRVVGTNGATYYGRYGADWSQLCRLRKVKDNTDRKAVRRLIQQVGWGQ